MTDYSELKRAAERIVEVQTSQDVPIGILFDEFEALASPEAVLALIAENDALGGLLRRFVDGEHEQGENQAERHMYFTEAQSILALVNGELEAHTIVPDSAIKAIHAERDQLRAEVAGLRTGYEAYERVNAELKAEVEGLRATADLQKLLPEVSDALEELELHGLHSDQGYRKLKDWYRKVGLAYRVIQGPMFGAEHGELVSQNTWLRSVVEHYAQQHAPLEPIPDRDGWSIRLPGYDLPALLKDAERYRYTRKHSCAFRSSLPGHEQVTEGDYDAEMDTAMSKGGQS